MSPFSLSFSHLLTLLFASLPPFAFARRRIFLRYRLAKNYTCHRHDFDFDDFVMKSRFVRRFYKCSFYMLNILHKYSRDVSRWQQIMYLTFIMMAFILHILHYLTKSKNLISLKESIEHNRRAYYSHYNDDAHCYIVMMCIWRGCNKSITYRTNLYTSCYCIPNLGRSFI